MAEVLESVLPLRLPGYLRAKLGAEEVAISELTRTVEGLSWETFSFRARWRGKGGVEEKDLIIRLQPEHGPVPPYNPEPQFRILQALEGTDVPVPRVYWLEKDAGAVGMPFFIMEKVEGEVPLPWGPGGAAADPEQRARMAQEVVRVLAALHNFDWRGRGLTFLPEPISPTDYVWSEIERWHRILLDNELLPEPLVAEAVVWLKRRPPPAPRTTLVHGDYRVGNFIWRDGHIAAFLDWEMIALGDPISDVAWVCLALFRGRSPLVCGLMEREDFLRRYQELTGLEVDAERLHYWEVLNHVKMAAIFTAGLRACADRRRRELRLAVFEFDYLGLLNSLAQLLGF